MPRSLGLLMVLSLYISVPMAGAQSAPATLVVLTGAVSDASNAALPGASVEVTSGGRLVSQVTSSDGGRYRIQLAANSAFEVRVVLDGFVTQTFSVRTATADLTRDVTLEVGGINETVVVTGVVSQHLTTPTPTGSRLGLSPVETPASVEIITGESMQVIADQTITAVASRATGIINTSSAFGFSLSARGFSGANSVMQLYDGMRMYSTTVTFPSDPWMADRLEVLRGAASVLYGEGAIGGAINVVRKEPTGQRQTEIKVSAASFGTVGLNVGTGGAVGGNKVSYRIDVGLNRTDGWMERGDAHNTAISAGLRYQPTSRMQFTLTHDFNDSNPRKWYGAPTVNGAFREEVRTKNYNVTDAVLHFKDTWTQLKWKWQPSDSVSVDSTGYYLTSPKHWRNAEGMIWNTTTNRITLGSFLEIIDDSVQMGNRSSLRHKSRIGGRANDFVGGVEVNRQRHERADSSPNTGSATVDVFNPVLIPFINPNGTFPKRDTRLSQYALFTENRFSVNDQWSVVGGFRYDRPTIKRIDLITPTANFTEAFPSASGRIGVVFNPTPVTGLYAQFATAADPVNALLNTTLAQKDFAASTGRQWEAGVKSSLLRGRAEWTFAAFDIVKQKLLTRDPFDPNITVQIGQQSSRGLEGSVAFAMGGGVHLQANASVLRARYDDFAESVAGVLFSRNGNVPANTPERSANIIALWNIAPKWVANTSVRIVGGRYQNAANTVRINGYEVVDLTVQYNVLGNSVIGLTARNLTNEVYARALYGNGLQWVLGDPRSVELSLRVRF